MQILKQILRPVIKNKWYQIYFSFSQKESGSFPRQEYIKQARIICSRHQEQTKEEVAALKKKYAQPVFGKVLVWDLIERLAQCVDPTDCSLYCTNQLIHTLQVLEGMERDGISDRNMILAALVHDLGKLLLLTGEAPENVVCFNSPISIYEEGIGLDNCVFQWNHDEFAYSRLKYHVPEHVAWLIRYHSISISECKPFMDQTDHIYTDRYLSVFAKYDQGTKSIYTLPKKNIENYREFIEQSFPDPIYF